MNTLSMCEYSQGGDILSKHKDKDKKSGSLCRYLSHYEGQAVILRTRSGDVIEGTLNEVEHGIVIVTEPVMISPFLEEQLTFLRCDDIESFSVSVTDG